jgi:UDP-N-acetylmuramate--alanine ligase
MEYYLVGIKGCAMTALANLLYEKGHIVRGCDIETNFYTESKLKRFKIDNINNIEVKEKYFYIIGNAYVNHDMVNEIKRLKYHYLCYPEFVSKFFKYHKQLCVSGSHGKTTSSAMLKCLIDDCNYIIGDGSGGASDNDLLVIEACEYKNTFLNYDPYISLVLNIDYDHPDFFKTVDDYIESFKKLIDKSMIVIANGDDKNINKIRLDGVITFGMNNSNNYIFKVIEGKNKTIVIIDNNRFVIPLVGLHYASDFVGVYLCAKSLGVTNKEVKERIRGFKLPNRRLEEVIIDDIVYINDYAHHPTEIKALYNTLRTKYSDYRLICFFQPHTISRSVALMEDFKTSLSLFDETYINKTFTSIREMYDESKEKEVLDYWNFPLIENSHLLNFIFSKKSAYIFVGAGDTDKLFNELIKKVK